MRFSPRRELKQIAKFRDPEDRLLSLRNILFCLDYGACTPDVVFMDLKRCVVNLDALLTGTGFHALRRLVFDIRYQSQDIKQNAEMKEHIFNCFPGLLTVEGMEMEVIFGVPD